MERLREQFELVNPQLSAPADGPDCIEGGVFIINSKNQVASREAGIWGKRKPNTKRI